MAVVPIPLHEKNMRLYIKYIYESHTKFANRKKEVWKYSLACKHVFYFFLFHLAVINKVLPIQIKITAITFLCFQ